MKTAPCSFVLEDGGQSTASSVVVDSVLVVGKPSPIGVTNHVGVEGDGVERVDLVGMAPMRLKGIVRAKEHDGNQCG